MPSSSMNHYSETQTFSNFTLLLATIVISGMAWFLFINQIILSSPIGNYPLPDILIWSVFIGVGIIFPITVYSMKMTVVLMEDRLIIRFFIFESRVIYYQDMEKAEIVDLDPTIDYGGWGIKRIPGEGWSYSACGLKAVMITLTDGHKVLIGSVTPERFFEALRERFEDGEPMDS